MPTELGRIKELQTLDLPNNQLSLLPAEICELTNLIYLDLRGNPLRIPLEILEDAGNPNRIIRYYLDL